VTGTRLVCLALHSTILFARRHAWVAVARNETEQIIMIMILFIIIINNKLECND
jgi:hypothetical membrane protein